MLTGKTEMRCHSKVIDLTPHAWQDTGMNITILPPGYAHGYAPHGEISDFIRDVSSVAEPQRVMAAWRKMGDRGVKRAEKACARRSWAQG